MYLSQTKFKIIVDAKNSDSINWNWIKSKMEREMEKEYNVQNEIESL